jgi:hypothetical protein
MEKIVFYALFGIFAVFALGCALTTVFPQLPHTTVPMVSAVISGAASGAFFGLAKEFSER